MSEPTQEAKDKPEAAGDAPAAPAKAAGKEPPLFVLIGVVVLALGVGAALGSLLIAPRIIHARQAAAAAEAADPHHKAKGKKDKKDKKGAHEKKGEAGKSPVYKLDNIIVNPADSEGQRFLMCTVAIESDDSKALDDLREHEIELRDHVVTLLAKQSMQRLTHQNARDSLRAELLAVIKPVLGEDGEDVELKVFLPQFVVQ